MITCASFPILFKYIYIYVYIYIYDNMPVDDGIEWAEGLESILRDDPGPEVKPPKMAFWPPPHGNLLVALTQKQIQWLLFVAPWILTWTQMAVAQTYWPGRWTSLLPRATGRNGSNCRTRMDALNYLARIGNNQHGFILRSSTVFCLIEIPCLSDNMCFRTWCPPYFSGYEFGCSSCRQSTQIRVESPCFFGQGHRWFVMFDHSKLVYPSEIQTWQLNISDR